MKQDKVQAEEAVKQVEKRPYEAPAIIYSTMITTRAGSPLSIDDGGANGVDPMDLFGE